MGRHVSITLLFIAAMATSAAAIEVFPLGSEWKYLDTGVFEDDWQTNDHDDSAWLTGNGQFGYGDNDETTVISFGPDEANKVVTAYFRKTFSIRNPAAVQELNIGYMRDDGLIIYLNGVEVTRDNMAPEEVAIDTLASAGVGGAGENQVVDLNVPATGVISGVNVIAVELHQNAVTSSDATFDMQLSLTLVDGASLSAPPCAATSSCSDVALTVPPFLQAVGPTTARVALQTESATSVIGFVAPATGQFLEFVQANTEGAAVTHHVVEFRGLTPNAEYQYTVTPASESEQFVNVFGTNTFTFKTPPSAGHIVDGLTKRYLVTAGSPAQATVTGWSTFRSSTPADATFVLGNAANTGATSFMSGLFTPYATETSGGGVYPLIGGREEAVLTDVGTPSEAGSYFSTFLLPSSGEAGGTASGTEAYYSFDQGSIHFVVLNSFDATSAQTSWLTADLSAAQAYATFVVAFVYHPPYSKSNIDSDLQAASATVREQLVPVLEAGGVDVVISGQGQAYERSSLINGHTGDSTTFTPAMAITGGNGPYTKPAGVVPNSGTMYVVAGSAAAASSLGANTHPAHVVTQSTQGVLVLEAAGLVLTGSMVGTDGAATDTFQITKLASGAAAPSPSAPPAATPSASVTPSITPSPAATPSNSPSPSVAGTATPTPTPTISVTPSVSAIALRGNECVGGVCTCQELACCGSADVEIVHGCRGNTHTVAGWEMTVAGVSLLAVVGVLALYAYFKPKMDAKQKRGNNLPKVKMPRSQSRPHYPNVL